MTDAQILAKIKKLKEQSDELYKLSKVNQYCKIEEVIFKYTELLRKRDNS